MTNCYELYARVLSIATLSADALTSRGISDRLYLIRIVNVIASDHNLVWC